MKGKYFYQYVIIFILMAIVAVFCLFSAFKGGSKKKSDYVTVALAPVEGVRIESDNPVKVKAGENAKFKISFEDGFFFDDNQKDFSFANGVLTTSKVKYDKCYYFNPGKMCNIELEESVGGRMALVGEGTAATGSKVSVKIYPDEHYTVKNVLVNDTPYPAPAGEDFEFTIDDHTVLKAEFVGEPHTFMVMSNNLGEIKILNQTDEFFYGDVIKLSCSFDDTTIKFHGYSENGYLADGGKLITTDKETEWTLTEDTILYANFEDRSTYTISFDANGGNIASTLDMECSPNTNVNLPVDTGVISRAGYVLIGYNTAADGSGDTYSLGAMMRVPRADVKLYALWSLESPTDKFSFSGGVITAYNGDESIVTIPQSIAGIKVRSIGAGAFKNKINIEKVIIPLGVTSVGDNAFYGCSNLKLAYLPESLTYLSATAFAGCDKFTTINVLANLGKAFDFDYDSGMADKYIRLKTTTGKRLIVVSGSSSTFGLDSKVLATKYPDYTIINFSCSFLYGALPLFDMLNANVHEGDIVIFAPEYYTTMYANEETTTIANWQYIESNYDILNDINLQNNKNLLPRFTKYLERKRSYLPGKLKNTDSVYVRSGMNEYGDLIVNRGNKGTFYPEIPSAGLVTELGMSRYNAAFKSLSAKGAKVLFSFPPVSSGGSSKEYFATKFDPYMKALTSKIDKNYCTIISKPEDYTFDSKLFYDNFYHLTNEGATKRSEQLIADLDAYFKAN